MYMTEQEIKTNEVIQLIGLVFTCSITAHSNGVGSGRDHCFILITNHRQPSYKSVELINVLKLIYIFMPPSLPP